MKLKKDEIVEVVWLDHCFHATYAGGGLARQRSVGFFVMEDDETIRIAHSLTDGEPADVLVVGKAMLKKVRRVKGC